MKQNARIRDAIIVVMPILVFVSIMIWFSEYPLPPNSTVEASSTNLAGFLTSNFVYDGITNVENIAASSAFLLLVCFVYPLRPRTLIAYLLPFTAVASGGLAEMTAITSPYLRLDLCGGSCSFYGMSGIASASVGFTSACFLVSFGLIVLHRRGRLAVDRERIPPGIALPRNQLILICGFALYITLLLYFSGILSLPVHGIGTPGANTSSSSPPPPAILIQTPPVAFVHSVSLAYGFLFFVFIFIAVNRRYRFLGSPNQETSVVKP